MAFSKNVFINCPFDDDYLELLRPLLFTVIFLGLKPRISTESLDSAQPRIMKIEKLIRESKFAVHDLSRLQAKKKGEYFRLNMPLELGIDYGCRRFGRGQLKKKKALILEAKRYRFQAAISDLSGSDIRAHRNEPREVVFAVRNWLHDEANLDALGASAIWSRFNQFMADDYTDLILKGYSAGDIRNLSPKNLMKNMIRWVQAARSKK